MKRILLLPILLAFASAFASYVGCENAQQILDKVPVDELISAAQSQPANNAPNPSTPYPQASTVSVQNVPTAGPANTSVGVIRVASFNVQAFGPSKMDNPWVMERLAAIIRNFDVVAIQEIRSKDQQLMNVLLNYVNQNGSRYNYLLGERLGRTVSKEQYAYVFNTATIFTSPEESYTVRDDEDLLHREPLVARFAVRVPPGYQPFTFTLANVHTDPDEVPQEVAVLGRVYQAIANFEASVRSEDDIIMLGDFNADARMLASAATYNEFTPIIVSEATNILRTKQYDNILLNPRATTEFTGRSGVFDLESYFGVTREELKTISDHLPVWAEFSVLESNGRTISAANDPTTVTR